MKIGLLTDAHLFHKNSNIELYNYVISTLQNKVDIIIDCGDLIDSNIINSDQANDLYKLFCNIEIPFHIIRGNHDAISDKSLTSILSVKDNIIIHNDVSVENINGTNILFVPYINKKYELFNKLEEATKNLDSPCEYAFSHLNITKNVYSMIPFERTEDLLTYAEEWFNGHIHTPESISGVFGKFINIGSFSSLTFSDEHIPCYYILNTSDTDYKKLQYYTVKNSIIHKTYVFDDDIDNKIALLGNPDLSDYRINYRIKIPNSIDMSKRQEIKNTLNAFDTTNKIQFDYIKENNKEKVKVSETKINKPLIQQLIEQFENKFEKLDNELKSKLI